MKKYICLLLISIVAISTLTFSQTTKKYEQLKRNENISNTINTSNASIVKGSIKGFIHFKKVPRYDFDPNSFLIEICEVLDDAKKDPNGFVKNSFIIGEPLKGTKRIMTQYAYDEIGMPYKYENIPLNKKFVIILSKPYIAEEDKNFMVVGGFFKLSDKNNVYKITLIEEINKFDKSLSKYIQICTENRPDIDFDLSIIKKETSSIH